MVNMRCKYAIAILLVCCFPYEALATCSPGFIADILCEAGVIDHSTARRLDEIHKQIGSPVSPLGPSSPVSPSGPSINPFPQIEASPVPAPTRAFVGPQKYPPKDVAAYGIVAFSQVSVSTTLDRHMNVCRAYWATLVNADASGVPRKDQMITVWPVSTEKTAFYLNSLGNEAKTIEQGCSIAVAAYHLLTSELAIKQSNVTGGLSGRGPFLLAWAPASAKGRPDVNVLVDDLSQVDTEEQFEEHFRKWKQEIQDRPELWRNPNGWDLETLRVKIRNIFDSRGQQIMFLFGGK
jgi:hypothetical protein